MEVSSINTRCTTIIFIRLLLSTTNFPEAKLSSTFLSSIFWKYSKTFHQQPENIQRLLRLQNCLSRKSSTTYSGNIQRLFGQSTAATSSSNQQQPPAAAINISHQQQQSTAATSSSSQQQQPAAAINSSNQQQQSTAATKSSDQQQQSTAATKSSIRQQQATAATTSFRPTSITSTIHDDLR